ncbi:immune-associated nucleotide-binding protein 9-like isoform X2 [Salvia hispanica]|uniref:immune-associated nucleotide-binding protein 9-like isoform X2 n=1 Tax=Salvia hispanica TaxID=49212 RepID=UPI0020096C01|nr:immune-associated nucleotide-binding protein 9-like isoform X2 [Salvia hispanica]
MHRVIKFGLVLTLIILTSASIGAAGARGGGTRGLGFGDEDKISRQREELLSLVETVLEENGGTPYTHQLFQHMKIDEAAQGKSTENEINVGGLVEMESISSLEKAHMSRQKESVSSLDKLWAEEMAARVEADMAKTEHGLNELRERLSQATHRSRELQEHINGNPDCVIL